MKKNLIKGYRVALGYTQSQMAEKLNLSTNSYSDKEKGKRTFTATEIKKYWRF
ncbi:helix-turn-helix transcriptional regulator [Staphylococcus pseudintermedius]|nr:helix-turn-helix transcriptional regulator [Staphylococcus pseudintermedius]